MPKSETIRMMISSCCKATIPDEGNAVPLSKLRKILKRDLTAIVL
jgi:hypothetical protein